MDCFCWGVKGREGGRIFFLFIQTHSFQLLDQMAVLQSQLTFLKVCLSVLLFIIVLYYFLTFLPNIKYLLSIAFLHWNIWNIQHTLFCILLIQNKTEESFIFMLPVRKLRFRQLKWFIQGPQQSQIKLRSPVNMYSVLFATYHSLLKGLPILCLLSLRNFIFNKTFKEEKYTCIETLIGCIT